METSPLCVTLETTTAAGSVLTGTHVVLENSAKDTALWTVVSPALGQRTGWCDRNDRWELDVRACYTDAGIDYCRAVLQSVSTDTGPAVTCHRVPVPASYTFGLNLGTHCCDVETNEMHHGDDPIPDDLSRTYVPTSEVTVMSASFSSISNPRIGDGVTFAQCSSGRYIECPQAGTYAAEDNCRNHAGYWNVPAINLWTVVDHNGVSANNMVDVENAVAYDLGVADAPIAILAASRASSSATKAPGSSRSTRRRKTRTRARTRTRPTGWGMVCTTATSPTTAMGGTSSTTLASTPPSLPTCAATTATLKTRAASARIWLAAATSARGPAGPAPTRLRDTTTWLARSSEQLRHGCVRHQLPGRPAHGELLGTTSPGECSACTTRTRARRRLAPPWPTATWQAAPW